MIVGDSNMSEYTIYLRNGVTAILLSMIEDGAINRDLSLSNPVRSIKEVSHDPNLKVELLLDNGNRMTAVQIQNEFLDMALTYAARNSLDSVALDVLDKWQYVMRTLQGDPMDLSREIDWVAKKSLLESFIDRKGVDWEDSRVQMLDLQYHDTRPDKGLYHMLEREGRMERICTDEEIIAAVHNPPVDTRAYFRGECLRRFPSEVFGVNWDSISFSAGEEPVRRIMMSEPLKGSRAHVQELLNRSSSASELLANLDS
jgi:proteasome accessory factor A